VCVRTGWTARSRKLEVPNCPILNIAIFSVPESRCPARRGAPPARCSAGAVLRPPPRPPVPPRPAVLWASGRPACGGAAQSGGAPRRRGPRCHGPADRCSAGPAAVRPSVRAIYEQFTVGDNSGPLCYRLYRADGPAGMSESRSAAARAARGVRARHWHHVVSDGKTRTGPARSGVHEGSVASWSGPGPGPGPGGLMIIMGHLSRGGGFRIPSRQQVTVSAGDGQGPVGPGSGPPE
jgi:hypothetical protein